MTKKLTYEYVKNYFIEQNCVLLETEYKSNKNLSCYCGNKSEITFNSFHRGCQQLPNYYTTLNKLKIH